MCSEKSTVVLCVETARRLFGRCVLRDGLGSLAHGVLGQLTGQKQTDCCLDFSARDGRASVVVCQTGSFCGNTLEDVVDEGVHDRHGLAGDSSVGMNLFQHFVDVDAVRFPPPPLPFLVTGTCGLSLAGGLLGSLLCWFWRHVVEYEYKSKLKPQQIRVLFIRRAYANEDVI